MVSKMYPMHFHTLQDITDGTEHHTKLSTKDGAGAKLFLKEGKEGTVITDKNLGIQERKMKRQQRRSTGRSDTKIREKSFLTIVSQTALC